jgi:hypothetical protein
VRAGNTIHINDTDRAAAPLCEVAYAGIRAVWSTDGMIDEQQGISMQKENRTRRGIEKLSCGILLLMRGKLINQSTG